MGRNGKSLMGIPWEWELVTKLGMGRNGNPLHGNGREWECKKPFPGISSAYTHSSVYNMSTFPKNTQRKKGHHLSGVTPC